MKSFISFLFGLFLGIILTIYWPSTVNHTANKFVFNERNNELSFYDDSRQAYISQNFDVYTVVYDLEEDEQQYVNWRTWLGIRSVAYIHTYKSELLKKATIVGE